MNGKSLLIAPVKDYETAKAVCQEMFEKIASEIKNNILVQI